MTPLLSLPRKLIHYWGQSIKCKAIALSFEKCKIFGSLLGYISQICCKIHSGTGKSWLGNKNQMNLSGIPDKSQNISRNRKTASLAGTSKGVRVQPKRARASGQGVAVKRESTFFIELHGACDIYVYIQLNISTEKKRIWLLGLEECVKSVHIINQLSEAN